MKKKIKIIDLLCLISNGEEVPKEIKYEDYIFSWDNTDEDYYCEEYGNLFEYLFSTVQTNNILNDEVEILEDEEEKDISLRPNDELYDMSNVENYKSYEKLAYNFKVLKEKINQVVKEFNEYRKENE